MNIIPAGKSPAVSRSRSRNLYPVILCGGSGKRLWPLSRQAYPKQLLPLATDRTMLQETVDRARSLIALKAPVVLCSEEHRFLVAEQLTEIEVEPEAILCEPVSRNTAPALAMAAAYLQERDPGAIMLALPADHHIGDKQAFAEAVFRAVAAAERGWLVTFGIQPTRPETGYGYIERGDLLDGGIQGIYTVRQFIEKPDAATATLLLADGAHSWNSGMFMLPVDVFLEQLGVHSPGVTSAAYNAVTAGQFDAPYLHLDREGLAQSPDESVDYALMEHTNRAVVIPAEMDWSDIGSWSALRDIRQPDSDGNVLKGNVVVDGVRNSFVHANGRLVTVMGLEDVIVVDTEDALLVSHADKSPEVGNLVAKLKAKRIPESSEHSKVHRPWGAYESVEMGSRFQVKHIEVKPGGQLSLQMHHHRAEHWVVVSGTALVTCGTETQTLYENQSVFIPIGSLHRLENPGRIPLHLIEVQIGSYLGENDIVRFEDNYGRA